MKNIILLTLISLLSIHSWAQSSKGNLDTDKNTIDAKAKVNIGKFKTEIGARYDLTEKKFEILFGKFKLSAGDIVIAAEISKSTGKDIENIAEHYSQNRGKGWGNLAKSLGIKPGSSEFHALKSKVHNVAEGYHSVDNTGSKKKKEKGKGKGKKK